MLIELEQDLLRTATECELAGLQFMTYLNTIQAKPPSNFIRSTKIAIKYSWSSRKIEDHVTKLDRLRHCLILATLLASRMYAERSNREILVRLSQPQRDLHAQSVQHHALYNQPETLPFTGSVDSPSRGRLGRQDQTQTVPDAIRAVQDTLPQTTRMLNWLGFEDAFWRYEVIRHAYQGTYEWIFGDAVDYSHWDSFSAHLRKDVYLPYFISGKAGSGKSTLMKFIADHDKTKAALKKWAGSQELVVLHYFCWNAGTRLQQSRAGMLRTLLWAVFEQHSELIPTVLPRLYRNWGSQDTEIEPSPVEVNQAFGFLIERVRHLRLAVFIDGVDAFRDDPRDICLFLRSLAAEGIKVIVSGRPYASCLDSFAGCPTLTLQHWTRRDMITYVYHKLFGDSLTSSEVARSPGQGLQLASELADKAEGGFLWLVLVVRLLNRSLQDHGDDVVELQAKSRALPSKVEELFCYEFQ